MGRKTLDHAPSTQASKPTFIRAGQSAAEPVDLGAMTTEESLAQRLNEPEHEVKGLGSNGIRRRMPLIII
jgi:hypothetical protein